MRDDENKIDKNGKADKSGGYSKLDKDENQISRPHVGRPKVNPDYNPVAARDEMAKAVANIYLHPAQGMTTDDEGHATMKELQLYFGLTMTKIRKLLVTAGVYHFYKDGVDMVEAVQKLKKQGLSLEEIKTTLHISTGTANSFLPYKSGIYNADFTADDYDFSNVSTEARRKRNQRKREKMKDSKAVSLREKNVKEMQLAMDEQKNINDQKYPGLTDEEIAAEKARHMAEKARRRAENEARHQAKLEKKKRYNERRAQEEQEDPVIPEIDVQVLGENWKSTRTVHGNPVGDYIFIPDGDWYMGEGGRKIDNRIVEGSEDSEGSEGLRKGNLIGVIDAYHEKHIFEVGVYGPTVGYIYQLTEVKKCTKKGSIAAGQPDTDYEFSIVGKEEDARKLMRALIEKAAVSLQNLTIERTGRSKHIIDSAQQCLTDKYVLHAKESGTFKVVWGDREHMLFKIDGHTFTPSQALNLFSSYEGMEFNYQVNDTDEVFENDMMLLPIKITADTLGEELTKLLFALTEKHEGKFIRKEDVAAFDTLFAGVIEKLDLYYHSNPRKIGRAAGDKLIKILKGVGTDDDMFPEYEIKMVQDAIRDLWE